MMVYMNSKEFNEIYLNHEYDGDILKAQYVIVSNRIMVHNSDRENIISARSLLFPGFEVCSKIDEVEFKKAYMDQLSGCMPFLATLIKGSIEEGYDIIFLCTKKEDKMHYLRYLSLFIAYSFYGYPVYNYTAFVAGCKLSKYNEQKILKKCNKILNEAKENEFSSKLKSERGRAELLKRFKNMDKKELKEMCKKEDLYRKGMSKSEMIDVLEEFLL